MTYMPLHALKECTFCQDVGVIRVFRKSDRSESLVRDACSAGNKSGWELPQWSSELATEFDKERCPKEWFMPSKDVKKDSDISKVIKKAAQFKKRIRDAQEYWAKYKGDK